MSKKMAFLMVLTVAFAASFEGAAFAADLSNESANLSAKLTKWEIDPNFPVMGRVVGGEVAIEGQTAKLTLAQHSVCPGGRFCSQIMPAPIQVSLPIVSTRTDECGTVVTVAQAQATNYEFRLDRLTIRDNRANHCPTYAKLAATEVVYEKQILDARDGKFGPTSSTFWGDELRAE